MPLAPDRELELRELAVRLLASRRHKRVGRAIADLLFELDLTRARLHALWCQRVDAAELLARGSDTDR